MWEAVAAELRGAGHDVRAGRCDVRDAEQVRALVARIFAEHGRLDVAVCNAGGASARGALAGLTGDDILETLRLNVLGTLHCAQEAARVMGPQGHGSIITVGSIHGILGSDRRTYAPDLDGSAVDYHAAKGAVVNLTRALAMELSALGIRVNCISPGHIPSPHLPAHQVERFRQSTPLGRTGKPEDLKGVTALLASDASSWITGQNIVVDGGWSAW